MRRGIYEAERIVNYITGQPSNWDFSFELMYDVSDYAVGAILGQHKEKTGVNGKAQAQALVQSLFKSDVFGNFYKGPFNSCVGRVCALVFVGHSALKACNCIICIK